MGAAMTQALSYRDQDVYMVGGANSAGQAAMYFSKYARKVTLLVRGDSLAKSMSQYLVDQINEDSIRHIFSCLYDHSAIFSYYIPKIRSI